MGDWLLAIAYRTDHRFPAKFPPSAITPHPRLSPLGNSPVFPLSPGLPLDLLLVARNRVRPGAGRQLERFGLVHRNASELGPLSHRYAAPDQRLPGLLELGKRIHQAGASQGRHDLASLPRQSGVVNEVLFQLEGRELDVTDVPITPVKVRAQRHPFDRIPLWALRVAAREKPELLACRV